MGSRERLLVYLLVVAQDEGVYYNSIHKWESFAQSEIMSSISSILCQKNKVCPHICMGSVLKKI